MKKFIVLSACPGSGKSTWAKRYCATHPGTKVISSDEVRHKITGQYQDFSKQAEVWETVEKLILEYALLSDVTVILDACIDLNSLRIKYAQLAKDYDTRTLVVIAKPLNEILENNKKRNPLKYVPEDVLLKLFEKFEIPTPDVLKCYDEYVYIDKYFK